jgi:hypothetical protein
LRETERKKRKNKRTISDVTGIVELNLQRLDVDQVAAPGNEQRSIWSPNAALGFRKGQLGFVLVCHSTVRLTPLVDELDKVSGRFGRRRDV